MRLLEMAIENAYQQFIQHPMVHREGEPWIQYANRKYLSQS
jgi:hypothetical protein